MRLVWFAWVFRLCGEVVYTAMADMWDSDVSGTGMSMSKFTKRLRAIVAPTGGEKAVLVETAIFNTQLWMEQIPWRPAGLWAAVAGLLAAGVGLRPATVDWQEVVLLLLLVELLWGGIWRMVGGRATLLPLPQRVPGSGGIWMPYFQAGSPAERLLGGDHTDIWPYVARVTLPTAVVALLTSAVLGRTALAATGLVIVLTALGWTARRTLGGLPALVAAVVAIGLPWLLAAQLLAEDGNALPWTALVVMVSLWVLHHWGEVRVLNLSDDRFGLGLIAVAELGICLLLVVVQTPLWLAPLVVLFLPTWLAAYRHQPFKRLRVLWLAAMLISAVALSQIPQ